MGKITLTKEQKAALAPYENELRCAQADYLRSVGREGNAILRSIYKEVKGEDFTQVDVCGSCQLDLQRIIARWYFDTPAVIEKKTTRRK